MKEEISVGNLVNATMHVWQKNIVPFTGIAILFFIPSIALVLFADTLDEQTYQIIDGILNVILGPLLTAGLTFGVIETLAGHQISAGASLERGLKNALPAIGIAFIVSLIVVLGLFLLIVPGVIAACVYAVAVPVAVAERGSSALSRSAELTQGHRMTIFLTYLVLLVVLIVISVVLGVILGLLGSFLPPVLFGVLGALIGAAVTPLYSCASIVIYQRLREDREGIDAHMLAEVFD